MSFTIDFLLVNGRKTEVRNILDRFLSSLDSQYSYQISYLNFYTLEKQCTKKTDEIFTKLSNRPIRKKSDNNYLIRYTKLCKTTPANTNLQNKGIKQTTQ